MKRITSGLLIATVLSVATAAHAMITPGDKAPNFTLPSADGKSVSLEDYKGKVVVLEWTSTGCPVVAKHYKSGNMQKLQEEFTAKGVIWLSISTSAVGQEGYVTPDQAKQWLAEQNSKPTAYLLDQDGTVGHLYEAKATPHMLIISGDGKLLYNGAIDSIHSQKVSDVPRAKNFVRDALNEILAGKTVSIPLSVPYGCAIRYSDYKSPNKH